MNSKKLLLIFLLFVVKGVFAQETWKSYFSPSNDVFAINAIAIDALQNKWIGTSYNGVAKFDGYNWSVYNVVNSGIINGEVYVISIDNQGNKWIGTWGGVSKFDGVNWVNYNISNSGLAGFSVYSIFIDRNGNKWFGTNNGVSKFDGTNWTTYRSENSGLVFNSVTCIIEDKQNNMWFGTMFKGISKFDGVNWTTYDIDNSTIPGNTITCVAMDKDDNIWFGTTDAGVGKFNGNSWAKYDINNSNIASNGILSIAIDFNGVIWCGTNKGTTKFDGTTWTNYYINDYNQGQNSGYSIAVDVANNKWFGTNRNGVFVLVADNLVLPITLNSCTGIAKSFGNVLSWQTASESNNFGFDIERKNSEGDFVKIGFVGAGINSNQKQNYIFTDYAPLNGDNYYRLKQLDNDGWFAYSNIVGIKSIFAKSNVFAYPNPAQNKIILQGLVGNTDVVIAYSQGVVVKTVSVTDAKNVSVDISNFPAGIYHYSNGNNRGSFLKKD